MFVIVQCSHFCLICFDAGCTQFAVWWMHICITHPSLGWRHSHPLTYFFPTALSHGGGRRAFPVPSFPSLLSPQTRATQHHVPMCLLQESQLSMHMPSAISFLPKQTISSTGSRYATIMPLALPQPFSGFISSWRLPLSPFHLKHEQCMFGTAKTKYHMYLCTQK